MASMQRPGVIGMTVSLALLSGCSKPAPMEKPVPLQWSMKRFEKTLPGCGDREKREEPCFTYRVDWPEVTSCLEPEAVPKHNAHIRALLQPASAPAGFDEEAARLKEQYREYIESRKSEDDEPAWFIRRTAEVIEANGAMFTIRVESTEYLGGAHANTRLEFVSLRPLTGEEYRLEDLINPSNREPFRIAVEKRFRALKGIEPARRLSEAGFTFPDDRFVLPVQFAVRRAGLDLYYNAYEIAPYSTGPTSILMTWPEIREHIRPESGVLPAR